METCAGANSGEIASQRRHDDSNNTNHSGCNFGGHFEVRQNYGDEADDSPGKSFSLDQDFDKIPDIHIIPLIDLQQVYTTPCL
jgi:hypothetical protein